MIELHVLSLVVGVVLCVLVYPRFAGRFFVSFRPWRKRMRPWPGRGALVREKTRELRQEIDKLIPPRGGISGKGTVDLKRVCLPTAPSGVVRARLAPLGENAAGQVTRPTGAGPTRKPSTGGSGVSYARHAHDQGISLPPPGTFVCERVRSD